MAANSISTKNIEEFIKTRNPKAKFLSLGFLTLVNKIETCASKNEITEQAALKELFAFFEKIEPEIENKAVILSCTHFPYIKEEIDLMTNLTVVDPAKEMIKFL